jgi:hypothetical protein
MFYTVYKITNTNNGKIYIGVHKTTDLYDGYMGSGKYITYSIEKHGIEKFKKEYIAIFDNPSDMYNMETELVNETFINREDTYNIKLGGLGGWADVNKRGLNMYGTNGYHENSIKALDMGRKKQNFLRENDSEWVKKNSQAISSGVIKWQSENGNGFLGKTHSEETKAGWRGHKRQVGNLNSQHGSRWICNVDSKTNLKIKSGDQIPSGWIFGRNKWKSYDKKQNSPNRKLIKFQDELNWLDQFYKSGESIRKFAQRSEFPFSHVTLSKMIIRHQ